MNVKRTTRMLWWIAVAVWTFVLAVAVAGETARGAEVDTIYVDGFEAACGYNVGEAERQGRVDVSFLSNPSVHYNQPAATFGDVFGFYFDCVPWHGACVDVVPFPGINSVPIVRMLRRGYIALAFTTAGLDPLDLAGELTVSTSNQVYSLTEWSFSDRCGDFDAQGSFLAQNPRCLDVVQPKQGFGWTTWPLSQSKCRLLTNGVDDPDRVWWLNIRVLECDDASATTCSIHVKNQG